MKWIKQLNHAIEYIENNLTGEISYKEAADIACCSVYYFQRLFSYIVGISLSDYIRRRRMTQAAFELQSTKTKIMDIGAKYGYTSSTSFCRAFQSVHNSSPTAARMSSAVLNAYLPIHFSIVVTGNETMKYRIETKEAIRVVGVRIKLQKDIEENRKLIPIFYNKVLRSNSFLELYNFENQSFNYLLGVNVYKTPQDIYYYIATQTNQSIPKDMLEFEIPAATWVIFECNGSFPDAVQTMFKRFFTEWLPYSGYEYAQLPDIEVYPISTDIQKQKEGDFELWIAIKKQKEE